MPGPAMNMAQAPFPHRVGKYDVFAAFATGGMATIHVGRIAGPGGSFRFVAVKQINPELATSERHAKMLLEEARLAAHIKSPYVVPTFEVIHDPQQLCIVMELVRGVSLDTLLQKVIDQQATVKPAIASAVLSDALRGLHAAHEAVDAGGRPLHVIHRDVSPHNLIVGTDGVTRVLDFGIAKGRDSQELTQTGEVKGKVGYMPPEQLGGQLVTRSVDIYAAGIVLWEALVGARLRDDGAPSVLAEILNNTVPSPRTKNPGLPAALEGVVMTAVESEPSRRFATAEAMATALERACPPASRDEVGKFVEQLGRETIAGLDAAVRACQPAMQSSPSFQSAPSITAPRALPRRKPSTTLAIAAAAVLVIVVAAAAIARLARKDDHATIPEARAETPVPAAMSAVPPSASPPSSASCTPPFEYDANGRKRMKAGCAP